MPRKASIPETNESESGACCEIVIRRTNPFSAITLNGLRRIVDQETFEDLVTIQAEKAEILGYFGVSEKQLSGWCRRVYHRPLDEMLSMIRCDGLIEIRRCGFEHLKKSATFINQQYNRYLPTIAPDAGTPVALQNFIGLANVPPAGVASLFGTLDPDDPEGQEG